MKKISAKSKTLTTRRRKKYFRKKNKNPKISILPTGVHIIRLMKRSRNLRRKMKQKITIRKSANYALIIFRV